MKSEFIIIIIIVIIVDFFFHLQDVKDMVNFKTVSSQTKTILTPGRKKSVHRTPKSLDRAS